MPARRLQVNRLRLNLPGFAAADGGRIGELVAANLATAGALPQVGDLPDLQITLTASSRSSEALARQIADQILRAVARSL